MADRVVRGVLDGYCGALSEVFHAVLGVLYGPRDRHLKGVAAYSTGTRGSMRVLERFSPEPTSTQGVPMWGYHMGR